MNVVVHRARDGSEIVFIEFLVAGFVHGYKSDIVSFVVVPHDRLILKADKPMAPAACEV